MYRIKKNFPEKRIHCTDLLNTTIPGYTCHFSKTNVWNKFSGHFYYFQMPFSGGREYSSYLFCMKFSYKSLLIDFVLLKR